MITFDICKSYTNFIRRYHDSADDKHSKDKPQWEIKRIARRLSGNRTPTQNEEIIHFLNAYEKQEMPTKQKLLSLQNELGNEYIKRLITDNVATDLPRSSKYRGLEKTVDEVLKSLRKSIGSPLQSASKHETDNFMEALLGNKPLVSKLESLDEYK